ncbi:E3 ubiquitin-protein ligase RING1-like isoform X3 [Rhodamnia argentea]|uniref:RING-type E3 ubiquitin transferase n=1 Tax=Rhodamnia argentea TaxID=178133 RepID=A0A8B8QWA3_9MYRT|nr:E3 ubiquitin-protein ligase RING1-like isoform X3 [Rhodamnia argentea]
MDSVASDSRLNVREESDWEEEVEVAIGEIERMMASPEQEEPLQDPDQEFSFSFFPEGFRVNPNFDSDPELLIQGDHVDPDESFTAVSQQILRNEIAGRDNSRASARVVENLPLITVSEGGLGSGDGICAVCKDKYVEGEKVKVLPCVHRYHQDCILPWLRMHNTCPVCRFELPKDDSRLGGWRTVRDGGMHGGGLHSDTPI